MIVKKIDEKTSFSCARCLFGEYKQQRGYWIVGEPKYGEVGHWYCDEHAHELIW